MQELIKFPYPDIIWSFFANTKANFDFYLDEVDVFLLDIGLKEQIYFMLD